MVLGTKKKTTRKTTKSKPKKITSNDLLAMPTKSKSGLSGLEKKVTKKEKKPKISIDKLRTVYTILLDDPLPEMDEDDSEADERKELIAAIKKVLK